MKTPKQSGSPLSGGAPGSPRRGGGDKGKPFILFLVVFAVCLFSLRSSFSLWKNNGSEKLRAKTPTTLVDSNNATNAPNVTMQVSKKTEKQKSLIVTELKKPAVHETLSLTGDTGDASVKELAANADKINSPDKHPSESRSESLALSKKPADDHLINKSKHDPEIALVAVVSMQRSSSSALTNAVLTNNKTNPCVLSLNEIFVNTTVGSGDAWPVDGKDLTLHMFDIKPRALRDFVMRVAKRRCVRHLQNDADNVCGNRCIVGFKEFDNQLSLEQHKWLWRHTPNMTTVVLERNVEDRWKSKWVAIQTGDWDTHGSLWHKNQIAAMDIPPMSVSETDEYCKSSKSIMYSACNFGQTHKEWYEFVRAKIHYKRKVEVSFDAAILNGGSYARRLIASALPLDLQDLLIPPAERMLDPQLAFVAVVSMQRSSSSTLTNLILSNNKTNPCVLSLNEIFINSPRQSGDAWPIDGRHLQNSHKASLNPVLLRDFLVRVAKRRCVQQLTSHMHNKCDNRCIVTFKQFREHLKQEHHEFMWSNIPNLTLAVLERNVQDRWKSRYVAEMNHDWNTHGSDWHTQMVKETHVPPMNVSESEEFCKEFKWNQLCHFEQKHKEWYKLVREEPALANKRVEVSFENVVENKGETARIIIATALPLAFQPIVRLE